MELAHARDGYYFLGIRPVPQLSITIVIKGIQKDHRKSEHKEVSRAKLDPLSITEE